jgi:hypothetical protein
MQITLGLRERIMAANVGQMRRLTAMRRESVDSHGAKDLGWDEDIEGAAAELIVAKYLNVFWNLETDVGDPDIGTNIQVRWTRRHDNSLIVRPSDPADHFYVLVTGQMPTMTIQGFILGLEAQDAAWLRSPNGRAAAWFVPSEYLASIDELPLFLTRTLQPC